ncbi:MAG: hypothetical protein JO220_03340 [Hyphomicrobiales bacterium]|nr:hypothetical protein [Hyphomicrobiales bacterium]
MIHSHLKIAPATAAWIAMTLVASAAPLTNEVEIPTGDVWITPQASSTAPAQTAQRAPAQGQLPTGDFWPAEEDTARAAAETPALPHDQSAAREEIATGGVK